MLKKLSSMVIISVMVLRYVMLPFLLCLLLADMLLLSLSSLNSLFMLPNTYIQNYIRGLLSGTFGTTQEMRF